MALTDNIDIDSGNLDTDLNFDTDFDWLGDYTGGDGQDFAFSNIFGMSDEYGYTDVESWMLDPTPFGELGEYGEIGGVAGFDNWMFDPYRGKDPYSDDTTQFMGTLFSGEYEQLRTGIQEYWADLIGNPIAAWGNLGPEGIYEIDPNTGETYYNYFDQFDWAGEFNPLLEQAWTDIENYRGTWELEQDIHGGIYAGLLGKERSKWIRESGQAIEVWGLEKLDLLSDITGLETVWGFKQDELERLGIEAEDLWDLEEAAYGRRLDEEDKKHLLTVAHLDSQGIDAEALWDFDAETLEILGINAEEIGDIQRLANERQQAEASEVWTLQQEEYTRQAGSAIAVFNQRAQDIARRKAEEQQMWGLKSQALQTDWGAEKEALIMGARTGISQAQKAQSQAIFSSGLATMDTSLQDMEEGIRQQYGMQLSAGEEQLTNQLQIGSTELVTTLAGLQSDLDMSALDLEDTLGGLDAARAVSEAAYNSEIARLATEMKINEKELENLLEGYARDIEKGDQELEDLLDKLAREKGLSEFDRDTAKGLIQDNIDRGQIELANYLAGLTHLEKAELAEHNIDVADVYEKIGSGELSLEHALENNLISFRDAIDTGLMTYEAAIRLGAKDYEINVGKVYSNLSGDIRDILEAWSADNENILNNMIDKGLFGTGKPDTTPSISEGQTLSAEAGQWTADLNGQIRIQADWGTGTFDTQTKIEGYDKFFIPGDAGIEGIYLKWNDDTKQYEQAYPTDREASLEMYEEYGSGWTD